MSVVGKGRVVIVVIDDVVQRVLYFMTVSVGVRQFGRHLLASGNGFNPIDDFAWHRHRGPFMSSDTSARSEAEKPMSALLVASGTKADGAESTLAHIVRMLLVGLHVGAKLGNGVFVIGDLPAGHKITRGMFVRYPVGYRECVEPEDCILYEMDCHEARDPCKRKHPVSAPGGVFHRPDISLDIRYVLSGRACVEHGEPGAYRFKFVVAENGLNLKTALPI